MCPLKALIMNVTLPNTCSIVHGMLLLSSHTVMEKNMYCQVFWIWKQILFCINVGKKTILILYMTIQLYWSVKVIKQGSSLYYVQWISWIWNMDLQIYISHCRLMIIELLPVQCLQIKTFRHSQHFLSLMALAERERGVRGGGSKRDDAESGKRREWIEWEMQGRPISVRVDVRNRTSAVEVSLNRALRHCGPAVLSECRPGRWS